MDYTNTETEQLMIQCVELGTLRTMLIQLSKPGYAFAFRDTLTHHINNSRSAERRLQKAISEDTGISVEITVSGMPLKELRFEHQDYQDAIANAAKLYALRHNLLTAFKDDIDLEKVLKDVEHRYFIIVNRLESKGGPLHELSDAGIDEFFGEAVEKFLDTAEACLFDPEGMHSAAAAIEDAMRTFKKEINQNVKNNKLFQNLYNHVVNYFKSALS